MKSSPSQPDLSIVTPAYREGKRIGRTLDELAAYLRHEPVLKKLDIELIVVAADAGDNTDDVVLSKKSKFKHLELLKPGLAPVGVR